MVICVDHLKAKMLRRLKAGMTPKLKLILSSELAHFGTGR